MYSARFLLEKMRLFYRVAGWCFPKNDIRNVLHVGSNEKSVVCGVMTIIMFIDRGPVRRQRQNDTILCYNVIRKSRKVTGTRNPLLAVLVFGVYTYISILISSDEQKRFFGGLSRSPRRSTDHAHRENGYPAVHPLIYPGVSTIFCTR